LRGAKSDTAGPCEFPGGRAALGHGYSGAHRFRNSGLEGRLRERALRSGRQRTPEWIDYFAFSRGAYGTGMPAFAVGRPFWDNWFVWRVLDLQNPVVDASAIVLAVHQNHDYAHHPQGKFGVVHGAEASSNHQLAGGWRCLRTIADATAVLRESGLRTNYARHWFTAKRYARQAGRFLHHDILEHAWFFLLGLTRPVRQRLGLRAQGAKAALGNHK